MVRRQPFVGRVSLHTRTDGEWNPTAHTDSYIVAHASRLTVSFAWVPRDRSGRRYYRLLHRLEVGRAVGLHRLVSGPSAIIALGQPRTTFSTTAFKTAYRLTSFLSKPSTKRRFKMI